MLRTEIQINVGSLKIGMYVSRLDRPWVETPYIMQGIKINSLDDIEKLSKYCDYVYIDIEKGYAPKSHRPINTYNKSGVNSPGGSSFSTQVENEYTKLRRCVHEVKTYFKDELKVAKHIYQDVARQTEKIFTNLHQGRDFDIDSVKSGVVVVVDSVLRNPSAFMLVTQLEKPDNYAYAHAMGVSVWAAQFGRHLGLEREEIKDLALGGMLLDIGRTCLPDELFLKTGNLTEQEVKQIRTHVHLGLKLLADIKKKENISHAVLEMVATHHERADGSGYPRQLKNDSIPVLGRIAGIVDSYEAMTSKRPYREKIFSPHEAIAELYNQRGKAFQSELIEQFIQTVGLYPTGSLVELSNGQVGVVIEINDLKRLRPTVMMILDENKTPFDEFFTLDLAQGDSGVKVIRGLSSGAYGINMNDLFI